MTRMLSDFCANKIIGWEGKVLFVYDDFDPKHPARPGAPVKGTLTAGVGHTGPDVRAGMTVTDDMVTAWFKRDIAKFCDVVQNTIHVELTDNQFGALVSFAFNVGAGNFRSSTLVKKLNAGDYDSVPAELLKWTKSKGKQLPGLVNRRNAEGGLWVTGSFVASTDRADPPKPKRSISAMLGGIGTGSAATGTGGLGFVSETKDQLSAFADISYVQYALLGLTVLGLTLTGVAAAKRYWDTKA